MIGASHPHLIASKRSQQVDRANLLSESGLLSVAHAVVSERHQFEDSFVCVDVEPAELRHLGRRSS
jgi:hypothetical protein